MQVYMVLGLFYGRELGVHLTTEPPPPPPLEQPRTCDSEMETMLLVGAVV